jgi:hypothetical protein
MSHARTVELYELEDNAAINLPPIAAMGRMSLGPMLKAATTI